MLLGTYSVLGVQASTIHHQQLNHLKSVDSHCIMHWCVSILDRALTEVTTQSFLIILQLSFTCDTMMTFIYYFDLKLHTLFYYFLNA